MLACFWCEVAEAAELDDEELLSSFSPSLSTKELLELDDELVDELESPSPSSFIDDELLELDDDSTASPDISLLEALELLDELEVLYDSTLSSLSVFDGYANGVLRAISLNFTRKKLNTF